MTTFFDDIDDAAALKDAATETPLERARKAVARMNARKEKQNSLIEIVSPAAIKPQALPARKAQAMPSKPVTAPVSTATNENAPYMEGWAAREKALQAPSMVAPSTTHRPAGSGALPSRNKKSIILVSPLDGSRLYLDKNTDIAGLRFIDDYEYPNTAQVAEVTGNKVGPYFERRMSDVWEKKHGLVKRHRNGIGEDGWELTPLGMDIIHGANHGNPRLYKTSFEDNGNHNIIHRNNVTTTALKLSRGGSEGILYDIHPEDTVAGLPIITSRTLHNAGIHASANGNVVRRIHEQQERLLNSHEHPYEANWYQAKSEAKSEQMKAEAPLRLGVLPVELESLENIYKQRDAAFLFNAYVNGKYAPSLSVDFVTPRPKTGTVRADGRIVDFKFNHDAHRVFVDSEMPESMYQDIFFLALTSGMFGRFFAYADNWDVRNAVQDSWRKLFENGVIPPQYQGYRHNFLILRNLPQEINRATNGARTRIDG